MIDARPPLGLAGSRENRAFFADAARLSRQVRHVEQAGSIDVPTVVIHGDQDELIPFEMGRAVASAIRDARFIPVRGGHHNDLLALGGARLLDAITRFLAGR